MGEFSPSSLLELYGLWFCWSVNRRQVLIGLVIDGHSEGNGVTPIDLFTKPRYSPVELHYGDN